MNPFDVLTDDAVVTVGQWVAATGVANLARLQKTCHRLSSLLGQPALLRDIVDDRSVGDYKIKSLEQLALWEAVEEAGLWEENRIGFDLASLTINSDDHCDIQGSRARIVAVRRIADRFPETRFFIEAHSGTIAPPYIAVYFSQMRGQAVEDALHNNRADDSAFHFDRQRIAVTGWGTRISFAAARDSRHLYGTLARRGKGWAEIYLVDGGDLEFPKRPDFYQGIPPLAITTVMMMRASQVPVSDSEEEDDSVFVDE
jgi:outer membrane protein OmpA-like peptidoglycan-associated protein